MLKTLASRAFPKPKLVGRIAARSGHFSANSKPQLTSTPSQWYQPQRGGHPNPVRFFSSTAPLPPLSTRVCRDYLPLNRPYPYLLAAIHHFFPSYLPLAQQLSRRMPILTLGKPYSTSPRIAQLLNQQPNIEVVPNSSQQRHGDFTLAFNADVNTFLSKIKHILECHPEYQGVIFLDHGGDGLAAIDMDFAQNHRIVAIEHTTKGVKNLRAQGAPLNVIELASAAFKREVEPYVIAEETLKGLCIALNIDELSKDMTYGVVGYGAIGQQISQLLANRGYKVVIYDHENTSKLNGQNGIQFVAGLEALLYRVDVLISATGEDITASKNFSVFNNLHKSLIVASASSGDIEFLTLLLSYQKQTRTACRYKPFKTIKYKNACSNSITVLNGGTPVNMPDPSRCKDQYNELSTENNIAITRGAVALAIRQAIDLLEQPDEIFNAQKNYQFDSKKQQYLVEQWLPEQTVLSRDSADQLAKHFQDEQYIIQQSGSGSLLSLTPDTMATDTLSSPLTPHFMNNY